MIRYACYRILACEMIRYACYRILAPTRKKDEIMLSTEIKIISFVPDKFMVEIVLHRTLVTVVRHLEAGRI